MKAVDPVFDVENRVAVITGACGLIGRELVGALHRRGARVVVADIEDAKPGDYAASVGADVAGFACDVADAPSVARLRDAVHARHGQVDILINAHAARPRGFATAVAEDFPEELWDVLMDVNLKGTFLMCRDFGAMMLERGKGSIVNFSSTYGVVSSNPDLYTGNSLGNPVAYSVSKSGVIMLTRYLGAYWSGRGVRVNCVTPHGVANRHEPDFIERFCAKSPMRRLMEPHEIVGPVLYLASDASSYATGSNLMVDGGWTAW